MFTKYILNYQYNLFDILSQNVNYEAMANNRKSANLIHYENNLIPIVRTTTFYKHAKQKFLPIHYQIIDDIKNITNIDNLEFNNALIEIYNSNYTTMNYHSDQSLDLYDNSHICIFSCYNTNTINLRKLRIKRKNNSNDYFDIILEHNSIIVFSINANSNYLHKIILESNAINNDQWLGNTFRRSKTFIFFNNEIPYFSSNNKQLILADDKQKKRFLQI